MLLTSHTLTQGARLFDCSLSVLQKDDSKHATPGLPRNGGCTGTQRPQAAKMSPAALTCYSCAQSAAVPAHSRLRLPAPTHLGESLRDTSWKLLLLDGAAPASNTARSLALSVSPPMADCLTQHQRPALSSTLSRPRCAALAPRRCCGQPSLTAPKLARLTPAPGNQSPACCRSPSCYFPDLADRCTASARSRAGSAHVPPSLLGVRCRPAVRLSALVAAGG